MVFFKLIYLDERGNGNHGKKKRPKCGTSENLAEAKNHAREDAKCYSELVDSAEAATKFDWCYLKINSLHDFTFDSMLKLLNEYARVKLLGNKPVVLVLGCFGPIKRSEHDPLTNQNEGTRHYTKMT